MIADDIRSRLHAQPFQPFTVVLADGKEVLVHHHDYAWLTPGGYILYVSDKDGRIHHLSTPQIARVSHDDAPSDPTPGGAGRP